MERVSAKQVIVEAFVGLAATKPIDKITVREVCRAAGVSSVTFYNHFSDKTDLYSWESRQVAENMLARLGDDLTWREYLVSVFEGNFDARDVLPNLVNNTHGYESFANINARNHTELLTNLISKRPSKIMDKNSEYLVEANALFRSATMQRRSESWRSASTAHGRKTIPHPTGRWRAP